MGRSHRVRPSRLGRKLKQIRTALGLSQTQMVERLALRKAAVYPASISLYELGQREPPLKVLLRYAELGNICLDVLADDTIRLPARLPAKRQIH